MHARRYKQYRPTRIVKIKQDNVFSRLSTPWACGFLSTLFTDIPLRLEQCLAHSWHLATVLEQTAVLNLNTAWFLVVAQQCLVVCITIGLADVVFEGPRVFLSSTGSEYYFALQILVSSQQGVWTSTRQTWEVWAELTMESKLSLQLQEEVMRVSVAS